MSGQELIDWLSERERVNTNRGDQDAAKDCSEMRDLVERRYDQDGR